MVWLSHMRIGLVYAIKSIYGRFYYGSFIMGVLLWEFLLWENVYYGSMQYIRFKGPWGARGYPDGVNH